MPVFETIVVEFGALIPPLSPEELAQLEANIVVEGCRDPLVVWAGKNILLDGHHRLEICTRRGIEFKTVEIELPDREAAADWIDANQLGRRNLTSDQMSLLRGRRYNRAKRQDGGHGNQKSGDQNDTPKTADRLAKQHGVSAPTIKRDGKFAEAVEKVKAIDPDIEKKVMAGQAPPKAAVVEAADLLKTHPEKAEAILKGDVTTADVVREIKRADLKQSLESAEAKQAKAIQGVYDVIVIDPPWPMKKIERDCRPNQSEFEYPTMTEAELALFEIPAADDCHVWLWTTQRFLPMALGLVDAWGLKYVCTFVWHKPGGFQPVGLPQFNCEFVLYTRKGSPKFIDTKAFNTCFNAPRGGHSEKPEEFYEMVARVTAGRRIDMFGRRCISGFDCWGKESQ